MKKIKKYMNALNYICEHNNPGKKTVQKLMYLMERKGVNLELDYRIHFFGPYSSKLDYVLHMLQSNDIIDIDTSGLTHTVRIKEIKDGVEGDDFSREELDAISFVLDNFKDKSALELEGITTLDFVAKSFENRTDDDIVNEVLRIKGSKFSREQLLEYLNVLKDSNYLN